MNIFQHISTFFSENPCLYYLHHPYFHMLPQYSNGSILAEVFRGRSRVNKTFSSCDSCVRLSRSSFVQAFCWEGFLYVFGGEWSSRDQKRYRDSPILMSSTLWGFRSCISLSDPSPVNFFCMQPVARHIQSDAPCSIQYQQCSPDCVWYSGYPNTLLLAHNSSSIWAWLQSAFWTMHSLCLLLYLLYCTFTLYLYILYILVLNVLVVCRCL